MADLLDDGYKLFRAEEQSFNDGNENCNAILYAHNHLTFQDDDPYEGATGHGTHAEMHALDQFLRRAINYDHHQLRNYLLEIECVTKPCCKNCSAVLGLLDVGTRPKTYKVNKKMGSTQWCLPPDFRSFLMDMGYTRRDVNDLCGMAS
jgi:hypothetical protein